MIVINFEIKIKIKTKTTDFISLERELGSVEKLTKTFASDCEFWNISIILSIL